MSEIASTSADYDVLLPCDVKMQQKFNMEQHHRLINTLSIFEKTYPLLRRHQIFKIQPFKT